MKEAKTKTGQIKVSYKSEEVNSIKAGGGAIKRGTMLRKVENQGSEEKKKKKSQLADANLRGAAGRGEGWHCLCREIKLKIKIGVVAGLKQSPERTKAGASPPRSCRAPAPAAETRWEGE